jgi:hypothetical protein
MEEDARKLEELAMELEARGVRPPRITWKTGLHRRVSTSGSSVSESTGVERINFCNIYNDASVNNGERDSRAVCDVWMRLIMTMN